MSVSWSSVGGILKTALPVVATALTGGSSAVVGSLLSAAMGVDATPEAVASELKDNPEAVAQYKLAELEANKEVIVAAKDAEIEQLRIINGTMQVELGSGDPFVRRWRPFYGYCVAVSWAIQMLGFTVVFVWVAIKCPEKLAELVQQFALLTGGLFTLWGAALAVLGVSVSKRSKDKQLAAGANVDSSGSGLKGVLNKLVG